MRPSNEPWSVIDRWDTLFKHRAFSDTHTLRRAPDTQGPSGGPQAHRPSGGLQEAFRSDLTSLREALKAPVCVVQENPVVLVLCVNSGLVHRRASCNNKINRFLKTDHFMSYFFKNKYLAEVRDFSEVNELYQNLLYNTFRSWSENIRNIRCQGYLATLGSHSVIRRFMVIYNPCQP